MDRIAIAVIGFGRFGRLHALRLRDHPLFELRCVVDTRAEARVQAKNLGLTALGELAEVPPDVRAATVATPPETHAEIATTLMKRGLHVLVEKPLAACEADLVELLATSRETGRILCTGHVERFGSKRIQLCEGDLVEFHRAVRGVHGSRHAVLDLLVHDLDLFAYWLNLPFEHEIQVTAVRLDDGEIDATCVLAGLPLRLRAAYGAPASRASVLCGSASPAATRLTESHALVDRLKLYGEDALTRQYSAFHDRLRGLASPIADGMAGSAAARRALAILSML
jgi:predicted dehydrogenase